jgi:hypothetical protein
MRTLGVAVMAAALVGCGAEAGKLPDPIPTDGPNQVVVYVPGMT